jgi:spermidine/putrescine transport system ATP-binding protein
MDQGKVLQVGSPQQIYENPASDFVARFIGETNIFEGRVVSKQGGFATVETADFGSLLVEANGEAPIGARVSVAVRPEKIRICSDEPLGFPELNVRKGNVAEPIYSGFQTKYIIKLSGGGSVIVFRQHANWSEGIPDIEWKDEVVISWSARDAVVVESSTTSGSGGSPE